jgi:hypothetical protein
VLDEDDANKSGDSHQQNNNVNVNPMPPALEDIDWEEEIQFDPGKTKEIRSYHPNLRESVIRKYLANGPC